MTESIIATYPGFGALPRAIQQLLLTSEGLFFEDLSWNSIDRIDGRPAIVRFTPPKQPPKAPISALHPWSMN
jgi:hypothetical protein